MSVLAAAAAAAHCSIHTYDAHVISESEWHYHMHETWNFYYAAISRQHRPKLFSKIIERAIITCQNASYTGQAHCRRRQSCETLRMLSTPQIVKYQIRTQWRHIVYCYMWGPVSKNESHTRMLGVCYISNRAFVSYAYYIYHTRVNRSVLLTPMPL